ncbi:hypothetical protein A2858_02970 [Candidatus Daviesbacteria bacterium RIFCSPHIGHO2_01_FULL_36_37]|uniref:Uncharacterized protein n=4 Tax=Candidatus Daviesiibacteriota TaxID=1752718 RepID=A0A0G0I3L4_9BACT|nr:MAG: hypothetical protein US19_C0001G0014 [Candidatus Daviesbacteria bacterium GW2011_GWB1_36_5]KKQ14998.1 MAG: hypothetical protein US28_C0025G0021 [Candidatus Daviesbacteria bacterium GW2011_GWA1_36_8]OGE16842.1 MAG: hypothetical protein A2858_02970 [Candidatus Daviesbacteria bacterium RIFCSPHIGHO2_01_FULL_36_37]OGE31200.1 MAG: hypothetical protein A3C99_00945 [Candidatus Daviesbacteria bacterium RIFCSPHIGHO2_02_FULL_37_9]OGE35830.1 MAG: hypothetical protein A3E66_00855 [Candidatus Daviesb
MNELEHEENGSNEELAKNAVRTSRDINDLREVLLEGGGTEINFGYNLTRNRRGVDVVLGHQRYLFFQPATNETLPKDLFVKANVPAFETVGYNDSSLIEVVKIPYNTRPLDGMQFKEQGFTQSYLGAFEIMTEVGAILGKIYKATNALPKELHLSDLVLTQGQKDLIRLLPPYVLDTEITLDEVSQRILDELKRQDPNHPHESQIEILKQSFKNKIK